MHERVRTCASAHGIGILELPVRLGYSTLPLNSKSMPMRDVNLSWAGCGKALVNTSARLSSDMQCSIMIELSPTFTYEMMLNISLHRRILLKLEQCSHHRRLFHIHVFHLNTEKHT